MSDLPIPLLRTFVVVSETLNLSAAAIRLHKAPSTVSMQIGRLESIVGGPLLERSLYGVRLTETGGELKARALQLLNLHDQIVGTFKNSKVNGQVRLGTHDQYATRTLVSVLESFVLSYPEARLEVVSDHRPHHLIQLLEDGKLDLALVEMPRPSQAGIPLFDDELVWIRSAAHQAHIKTPLPLALFADGCIHRAAATSALQALDVPYRIAFTSQSRAGVLAAIRAGIGIGIIPRSTLEDGYVIIEEGLPTLLQTQTTLFAAPELNEASSRLVDTIKETTRF